MNQGTKCMSEGCWNSSDHIILTNINSVVLKLHLCDKHKNIYINTDNEM